MLHVNEPVSHDLVEQRLGLPVRALDKMHGAVIKPIR